MKNINNCNKCNPYDESYQTELCKQCQNKFKIWFTNQDIVESNDPFYEYYLNLIKTYEYYFFQNKKNIVIPLNILICGGMKEKHQFMSLIEKIINKDSVCSNIGDSIGNALIRNAATRIFSIPEQSIMELPVNSFDSYNLDSKIGKFGMGFFSIFYWLKDHPNRSLKIITKFQFITKKYEYAIDIVTESGLITELKINLLYFKQIDDDQITGTKITLNCLEDPLNTDNVVKMFNQLLKLRYYKKGLLKVNYNEEEVEINKNFVNIENPPIVQMTLNQNIIEVNDKGSGIPIDIALGSLLTPSISTKKINLGRELVSKDDDSDDYFVEILPYKNSRLVFLVQGIAILDIEIDDPNNVVLLFDFGKNARLPVARNDILLSIERNNPNYQTFEILLDMFNNMIQQLIDKYNNVLILQRAIKKYEQLTSQVSLKGKLTENLEQILINLQSSIIFLSEDTYSDIISKKTDTQLDLHKLILDSGNKIVKAELNNYIASEIKLLNIFDEINNKDIFDSRNIIFTSGSLEQTPLTETTQIRTLDFHYTILVDSVINKENYLFDIISKFTNEELQLISELEEDEYNFSWEEFINKISRNSYIRSFSSNLIPSSLLDNLKSGKDGNLIKDKLVKFYNVFTGLRRILGDKSISDDLIEFYISWYFLLFSNFYHQGFINEINQITVLIIDYIKNIPNILKKTTFYSESKNFRVSELLSVCQYTFKYMPIDVFNFSADVMSFTYSEKIVNKIIGSLRNSSIKEKLIKFHTQWIQFTIKYSNGYKTANHLADDNPENDYYLILLPSTFHFGIFSSIYALDGINTLIKLDNNTNSFLDLYHFMFSLTDSFLDFLIISFILITSSFNTINNKYKALKKEEYKYQNFIQKSPHTVIFCAAAGTILEYIDKSSYITRDDVLLSDEIINKIFLGNNNRSNMTNLFSYIKYKINIDKKKELLLKIYDSSYLGSYTSYIAPLVFRNEVLIEIKSYIVSIYSTNNINQKIINIPSKNDFFNIQPSISKEKETSIKEINLEDWINFVFSEDIWLETFDIAQKDSVNIELYNNLFNAYNNFKTGTRFQLNSLQIAINEATTREWEESVIIESIQNSMDAILSNYDGFSKMKNIKVNFGYDRTNNLVYSIEDFVGMKMSNLIAMMTPYFSTKKSTKDSLTTGEMGNGWFQIYSNAEKVYIETSFNGIQYKILDEVVRDRETNRVTDIIRNIDRINIFKKIINECSSDIINKLAKANQISTKQRKKGKRGKEQDRKEQCKKLIELHEIDRLIIPPEIKNNIIKNSNGTKITVVFKWLPKIESDMNKNRIINYINTILYNLVVPLPKQVVEEEGRGEGERKESKKEAGKIDRETIKIIYNDNLLVNDKFLQVDRDGFKIYRNKNSQLPITSYVLTNGLPFISLTNFKEKYHILPEKLIDHLYIGYTIDISKQLYDPIQSRTELSGFDVHLPKLRSIIIDLSYYQSLYKIKYYIQKYKSTENFKYLKNINEYISNYSANTTSWYNLILDTDYNHNKIKQNIRGLIRGEKYEYVEKKDLVMYHTLSDNNKPIGIILNKIYLELNKIDDFNKKYVKEYDFKYKVKDIIREIINTNTRDDIIKNIIMTTFEYKFSSIREQEEILKTEELKDITEMKLVKEKNKTMSITEKNERWESGRKYYIIFKELFSSYCYIYYKILNQKLDFSYHKKPKIAFDHTFSSTVAFSSGNKITVNIAHKSFNFHNLMKIINIFYSNKLYKLFNESTFNEYFGTIIYKEGTIPHEMEHFRTQTLHDATHHDNIPNHFNDPENRIPFSEFVNLSYNYCKDKNLLIQWKSRFIERINKLNLDSIILQMKDEFQRDGSDFNKEVKILVRDFLINKELIIQQPGELIDEFNTNINKITRMCDNQEDIDDELLSIINLYLSKLNNPVIEGVDILKSKCNEIYRLIIENKIIILHQILSENSSYYMRIKKGLDDDIVILNNLKCGIRTNRNNHNSKKLIQKYIFLLNKILSDDKKLEFNKEISWKSRCSIVHSYLTKNKKNYYYNVLFEMVK